jgi:hypothetical protein
MTIALFADATIRVAGVLLPDESHSACEGVAHIGRRLDLDDVAGCQYAVGLFAAHNRGARCLFCA